MSMVIKDESRQVNIAGLSPYKDTDGKKWFRMKIDMLLRGEDRVSPPLLKLVDVMREDGEVDSVSVGEEVSNVQLEFYPVGAANSSTARRFESVVLSSFELSKEKSTKSGTIEKEFSGRLILSFKTAVPMMEAGVWALEAFGNDCMMLITNSQGELNLGDPADPDSQAARNNRILEEEKKDSEAPGPAAKPKRTRKPKGATNESQ